MAARADIRRAGLSLGKLRQRSFSFVRVDSPVPNAPLVATRAGHQLIRDLVGFPHRVTLQCPPGALPEAAKLRLMKAFSLAVERLRDAGRCRVETVQVGIVVDPAARGRPTCTAGPIFTLSPHLVGRMNRSLGHLRAAVFALVEAFADAIVPAVEAEPAPAGERGPAKVLLFKNIFTKDVGGADAHQLNPGVHYLISSLAGRGVALVLLDAKLPLQDVCERPPLPDAPLAPHEFLTDPDELADALAVHRDLDLVCLTLLERSFGQVRALCRFIRQRSRAFIAIGGVFPTVTPEHAFVHLPEANFFVRGDGEVVLPTLVDALAHRSVDDGLGRESIDTLGRLEGLLARAGSTSLSVASDRVNRLEDLDAVPLDFSCLERQNVEGGLSISTSRGCIYGCHFCSVMDRALWRGKSVDAVMADLSAYHRRLEEIYGTADAIPAEAHQLQIWDDDFFLDPHRAAELLRRMRAAGFKAFFLQGTVASFFHRDGKKVTAELDRELLDALDPAFLAGRVGLKLGTENFCDRELRRLGKPYRYDHIRRLALELAARGIRQEHFRILCNRETSLEDLLDNFEKMAELRWAIGPDFFVLSPSWIINLYPTDRYRACQIRGTDRDQPTAGALQAPGFTEFDYPFVIPEAPERTEVFEIVRRFPAGMHFGAAGEPAWMFDGVHGPDDDDYLGVFAFTRRALLERRAVLTRRARREDSGELFRIDTALATRLGGDRWMPQGLLERLAPRLELDAQSEEASLGVLQRYVAGLLDAAVAAGDLGGLPSSTVGREGLLVRIERAEAAVDFLVQRYQEGTPCAFRSRNLAFVARGGIATAEQRRRASPLIEELRQAIERHDTHRLG